MVSRQPNNLKKFTRRPEMVSRRPINLKKISVDQKWCPVDLFNLKRFPVDQKWFPMDQVVKKGLPSTDFGCPVVQKRVFRPQNDLFLTASNFLYAGTHTSHL